MDGAPRVSGTRVDIGADELTCGNAVLEAGEACDDGNPVEGDGCDSNCTVTGCGNRIITGGEQCDDSGTAGGAMLLWKLRKGRATSPAARGDPRATDQYTLCFDDAAALPSGGDWRASGGGFTYRAASRAPDGIASEKVAPGAAEQTKMLVKGKGTLLDPPPLTVQLRGPAGACWGAAYSTSTTATATLFKARSD